MRASRLLKSFRLRQLGDGFCKLCGGTRNASPSVCVSDRIDSDHSGNPADLSEKGRAGIPKIREVHLWLNDRLSGLSLTEQSRTMEGR